MKRRLFLLVMMIAAAGCAEQPARRDVTYERISVELEKAVKERTKPVAPDSVSQALLPPLVVEMPRVDGKPLDQRFDLNVNNAPAAQVFMAIVGARISVKITHPIAAPSCEFRVASCELRAPHLLSPTGNWKLETRNCFIRSATPCSGSAFARSESPAISDTARRSR